MNKGAEAMLHTARAELAWRLGDAGFYLPSFYSPTGDGAISEAEGAGCELLVDDRSRARKLASAGIAALTDWRFAWAALRSPRSVPILLRLRRVDGMVDVSGFAFGDEWGSATARRHLELVKHIVAERRPCIYLPQAWGPFTDAQVAEAARVLCRYARVVYARDRRSHQYLVDLSPDAKGKIRLAPDIAFRFHGASPEVGARLLADLGIRVSEKPLVGIAPNMRVYERTRGYGVRNAYAALLAQVTRYCHDELRAQVVMIPHEILESRTLKDDRYLCALVEEMSRDAGHVTAAMTGEYSAAEIKSVIGCLDLLVASRYHSIVAAVSQVIPTVALGWAHKYDELMRDVGLASYVCDGRTPETQRVCDLVGEAWANRRDVKETLAAQVPPMRESVDAVLDHAADILRGGAG